MPGKLPAMSAAAQADSDNKGNLQVPTPESPLWYPQLARSGQQGLASTLPKFGLAPGAGQPATAESGLYSSETLPDLQQFELPLLKPQQVNVF